MPHLNNIICFSWTPMIIYMKSALFIVGTKDLSEKYLGIYGYQ
jgi:hypothetical protein